MSKEQSNNIRPIDDLIAQAEMDRMVRLFFKRRNRNRNQNIIRAIA